MSPATSGDAHSALGAAVRRESRFRGAIKQGIQGYAAWAGQIWTGHQSSESRSWHPGPRREAGVWVQGDEGPPPWPSAIPSPCRLLHQHQVLSSHSSGTWGFERRVQRPGFWSWPCLLAQGTSSLWASASSSVERAGANVWDQTSFPAPTTPATLPFFLLLFRLIRCTHF